MMRCVLTPSARADLLEIQSYLAERSLDSSEYVRGELETAFDRLVESPGLGHRRADLTDRDYRFWRVFSYLIVYDASSKPLRIIRVLHAARDARRELTGD
jgi:plasmid stabilization system protein ParE